MFCSKCGQEMPDSAEFCPKCGWKVKKVAEESVPAISFEDSIYFKAIQLAASNNILKLNEAISEFEKIKDYKDSSYQIQNIKNKINNIQNNKKKRKKNIIKGFIISAVALVVCVCIAGVSILEREYQTAMRRYEDGDYSGAYSGFSQDKLKYYRNSKKMMKKICPYEAGDIVTFGMYEQDGNLSNGPEPIEWVITYHSNDMGYAMVSKYCIDSVKCNDTAEFVDWEKSIPYNWLNDFYKNSFSVDEKELISKFDDIYYTSHFQCTDYAALASADLWHGWSWSEGVEETYYHTTATEYAKTKIATNGTYACWWNGYDLPLIEGTVYGTNVVDAPDSVTEHPANYEKAGIRPVLFVKFGLYGED